jgi:hypothetical protein
MAAAVVRAIDQQAANSSGAHLGEDDFLAETAGMALLKRGRSNEAIGLLGPPLYPEPICEDGAIHADRAGNAATGVRILGIQQRNDPGFRGDHANLAEARAGDCGSVSANCIGLVPELPNIGRVPAVHLEGARRRPKIDNEGIHVLSDIMLT